MKAIVALALLFATLPAWSVMYKWVDADGKVHYSDQAPPEGAKHQETVKVKVPPPPPAAPQPDGNKGATPKAKTSADQDMDFRKRRLAASEADAKRQQDADAVADKAKKCEQTKSRVTALQSGGRLTKYGPNGEQIYLTDDEISKELVDARKTADSWCK